MTPHGDITIRWRAILFTAALFWFWYLGPAVESRLLARVLILLHP